VGSNPADRGSEAIDAVTTGVYVPTTSHERMLHVRLCQTYIPNLHVHRPNENALTSIVLLRELTICQLVEARTPAPADPRPKGGVGKIPVFLKKSIVLLPSGIRRVNCRSWYASCLSTRRVTPSSSINTDPAGNATQQPAVHAVDRGATCLREHRRMR
jgi:hypothetical protein